MSFWDQISEVFSGNTKEHQSFFLEPNRVDKSEYGDSPISEGNAYCRLWLVEMRLAKNREFFKTRYPVLHSVIRFHYGGKTTTIPYLAGPGFLKELTQSNLDKIIQCNYPLTPLFPFNGGVVEMQAGLFSMVANDQMDRFITVLGRFANLLPVPQLSAVLEIAAPVYQGIEDLLDVGDGRLELGYQQTFGGSGGSNFLREGYFVALLSGGHAITERTLCVVNDGLYIGPAGPNKEFLSGPNRSRLEDCSYMLFRFEQKPEQDWESLTNIKDLVYQAQEAVVKDDMDGAKSILTAIKIAVFRSPDLTKTDKRKMVYRITTELQEWGLQSVKGFVAKPSLYAIMQRQVPQVDAEVEAELDALERLVD